MAVGLVLSFMLLTLALLLFFAARDELKHSLSGQLEVLVSRVATELDDKVLTRVTILEAMASKFPLAALSNNTATEHYFRDSPNLATLIDDFYLFSPAGVLLVDWPLAPGRRGLDMTERDYIQGLHGLFSFKRLQRRPVAPADEFVLVLEGLSEHANEAATQAETVGEKILAALNVPYDLAGHEYHNTPSIGVTLFEDHINSVDDLMKHADLALYEAKKAGRNTLSFFDPKMQATITARAALEKDLRDGLQQRQFLLYYQPQVDSSGGIIGTEALVRWRH